MYSRDYDGKSLNFEASGGLTNASLVMQDKQTNTFWSLMKGTALTGELKGQVLKELPLGEKVTWKEWKSRHPNSKVLTFNNQQDAKAAYDDYFEGRIGFRGTHATDTRLETMSPIFAFRLPSENKMEDSDATDSPDETDEKLIAIAYSEFESGIVIPLSSEAQLFLYRTKEDEKFRSTTALVSQKGFKKSSGTWTEIGTGKTFDPATREFGVGLKRLSGFDTFWYNWSLNNPDTLLLTAENVDIKTVSQQKLKTQQE